MNYIKITNDDVANGLGIRTTLWVSGCGHHCDGCHNRQSWDFNIGREFTENTMNELLELLNPSWIDGLTLSGGDPLSMYNARTVYEICKKVKETYPNKNIWLYTGFTMEELNDFQLGLLNSFCDFVVDGCFVRELKNLTLAFRGSSNQRILKNNHSIEAPAFDDVTELFDKGEFNDSN